MGTVQRSSTATRWCEGRVVRSELGVHGHGGKRKERGFTASHGRQETAVNGMFEISDEKYSHSSLAVTSSGLSRIDIIDGRSRGCPALRCPKY
jgi:hypothetical protein